MGTWLVVNAKRKKKSCEQPPYAVTKKSPFHSSRLLSLILLPDSSSSFPTMFFLSAVRTVLDDVPPVLSTFDAT